MKTQDLVQLSEEFGSPLYVYDAGKIEAQYKRLTNAFNKVERFGVHYAVKALSNLSILKYLKSLGSCLDTVSI
jgi:diaminopimelate decarboxylase